MRVKILSQAILFALPLYPAVAAWSCDDLTANGGAHYVLSKLGSERSASKSSETPPTTNEARVRMDLCGVLGKQGGVNDEDQCSDDTRVCLTLRNHKESASEPDRITAVIPMWQGSTPDENIRAVQLGSRGSDGVRIEVDSPDYAGIPHSLNLTLICDESATDPDPTLVSYTDGRLTLIWSTPDACPATASAPSDGSSTGFFSGLWWLLNFVFWLTFFGLVAYFLLGILYNRQQYSARGWDLIPHRDFWREMPSLLGDLGSHLVSGARSGTGRGGYSSLG